MAKPPPGKPKPTRWTIAQASTDFPIDRKTLTKKLRDLEPGEDGKYSTKQILSVLFDDVQAERIRLYREQADRLEIQNAKARAEQVDVETVYKAYEGVFIALRQSVLASNMTDAEKAECLAKFRHDTTEANPIE